MEQTTEKTVKSETEKLYDHAYLQGVKHAVHLMEVCAEGGQSLAYAIAKIKELMIYKIPTP